jgi:Domain of unknown function (DUF4180)
MPAKAYDLHGHRVLEYADGDKFHTDRDANTVIGDALGEQADTVVMPVACLSNDFFVLRTRLAGEIIQKFTNYRLRLVILGEITKHVEASTALRDFVHEANQRTQLWFVPDRTALEERLAN